MSKLPSTVQDLLDSDYEDIENNKLNGSASMVYYGCCINPNRSKDLGNSYVLNMRKSICYRDLAQILRLRNKNHTHLHLILAIYEDVFDYESLFNELNRLFGRFLSINLYINQGNKTGIVKIKENEEFTDLKLRHSVYMICIVMLRLIDIEYRKKVWKKLEVESLYSNWFDVIVAVYSTTLDYGHGLNDKFKTMSKNFVHMKDKEPSKTFLDSVNFYLNTLETLLGHDSKIKQRKNKNIRQLGQSNSFRYVNNTYGNGETL